MGMRLDCDVERHRRAMKALERARRGERRPPRWLRVLTFLFGPPA